MSETKSQNDAILADLKAGHRITALSALTRFHCLRLAARIHDLRAAGYRIKREDKVLSGGKRVAEYRLDELMT